MGAAEVISTARQDDIAVVRLARPPVNALTDEMRADLFDAIEAADTDPSIHAIVLTGEGASFCTGADPAALGHEMSGPSLSALCDRIEACETPVLCALHGSSLEAGLALALACHTRVMGQAAKIGAPDVTIGMVPSGGVTQRLPRLVGAGTALEMMLSGRPLGAAQAAKAGLVDHVTKGRPFDTALEIARRQIDKGTAPRRTRDTMTGISDGAAFLKEISARRDEIKGSRLAAPKRIIDCVEAALLMPFEVGVGREDAARADCLADPQTEALRHAFFAERRVVRLRAIDGVAPTQITTLGLAGATPLALGIAISALDHGLKVHLAGGEADRLVQAHGQVVNAYNRACAQGQITADVRDARQANFTTAATLEGLGRADVVIDATLNSTEKRARLLATLEEYLADDVVLGTVADRDFDVLAAALTRPQRFAGFHFFAPAQAIRVVELVAPDRLAAQPLSTAHALLRRMGKLPVTVGPGAGLIANVLQEAMWSAVDVVLLLGVTPARIDRVMRDYGFPAGPCAMMDALGLSHMTTAVPRYLAEAGREGRTKGAGFFTYAEGAPASQAPEDDAVARSMIAELRAGAGLPELPLSDAEICDRLVLAMANAGVKLLEAGTAARPVDIDVVAMLAKGFPRWKGGPMKAADLMTPLLAQKNLRAFADTGPDIWTPGALWGELVKNGDTFEKLNAD